MKAKFISCSFPIKVLVVMLAVLFMGEKGAVGALIPPHYLDCVVSIGYRPQIVERGQKGEMRVNRGQFVHLGSGFFYGDFMRKVNEKENEYQVFLVTNDHVLKRIEEMELKKFRELSQIFTVLKFERNPKAFLRVNRKGSDPASEDGFVNLWLTDDGSTKWKRHPKADVAVVSLNAPVLRSAGLQFSYFRSDSDVIDLKKAAQLGVSEGDGIYVLGFPMGLVGRERNYVVARQGSVARIRDAFVGTPTEFLADVFIFPGNSGGPVITKPEIVAIKGTEAIQKSYLIGIVHSYIPYKDVAVSKQTQRPRISFEENSGLASIIPMDFVKEIIANNRKVQKP